MSLQRPWRSGMAALIALVVSAPAHAQTIALAVVGPMSGPLAEAGMAMSAGAKLAASDINASGGVNGAKLTLQLEDDEAGIATARKRAEELARRNLRYVVGHYTSAPTLSAAEIYMRNAMLLIAPAASAPKLTERREALVLRLAPREDAQGYYAGAVLARDLAPEGVAIIRDGSVASRILAAAAQRALASAGKAPAQDIQIPTAADGPAIAAAQAQSLARAGFAALYWSGGASNVGPFLKALRAAGSRAMLIGNDALATPEFATVAGDLADGVRVTVMAHVAPEYGAADVLARLKADGVRDIDLALATYASVQVLQQAAMRANSLEPSAIARAARAGQVFKTIIGPVSFDSSGERVESPFRLATWRKAVDGKFLLAP